MSPEAYEQLVVCERIFGPPLAMAAGAWLMHRFGPNSLAARIGRMALAAIAEQGDGGPQAALLAKAGLAGLEDHPLVAAATQPASPPPTPSKN